MDSSCCRTTPEAPSAAKVEVRMARPNPYGLRSGPLAPRRTRHRQTPGIPGRLRRLQMVADDRSGRRRCASMGTEDLRRRPHATRALPGDASGSGGGRRGAEEERRRRGGGDTPVRRGAPPHGGGTKIRHLVLYNGEKVLSFLASWYCM
jgi:hypothetical protein